MYGSTTKRERRARSSRHSVKTIYKPTKYVAQCPVCQVGKYMPTTRAPEQQGITPGSKKHRCVKCQTWFEVV